jgi:hypothetical protein
MPAKSFHGELERAMARPDADDLLRHVQVYYDHFEAGLPEWSGEDSDALEAIMDASLDDPEKTFAYVMLAAANYDDADFLGYVACGPLENLLVKPSSEIVERVVTEARKTPRFRWMISIPFRHALAPEALKALEPLFVDADKEPLPPRPWI